VPVASERSTNDPTDRGPQRPCSRCGDPSYSLLSRRPDSSGQMASHAAQDHSSDGSPADYECQRPAGPKAAALAAWARRQAEHFAASNPRHTSWVAFAEYAESLSDSHPNVVFFDERGAFDHLDDNVFVAARVRPLDDYNDFLGTIGGTQSETGATVMQAPLCHLCLTKIGQRKRSVYRDEVILGVTRRSRTTGGRRRSLGARSPSAPRTDARAAQLAARRGRGE
jgi:hypothetical protein